MCWFVPPEADLPLGAACDFGECGEGKLCMWAEALPSCAHERCCTQWCDLRAPACEDPAATCEHVRMTGLNGGEPSFEWLGACVISGAFD